MDRLIVEVGGRKVYWELPSDEMAVLLTWFVSQLGPAKGDL